MKMKSTSGSKIFKVVSRHKKSTAPLLAGGFHYTITKINVYDVIVLNTNSLEYVFPRIGEGFGIPVQRVIHSHNQAFENKQGLARRLLVGMNKKLLCLECELALCM